jgi:hypothetical protein
MERDIADIEEFVEDTSLIGLNTRDIMKLHKCRILHEYRPTDINNPIISNYPDITVPVENFMKHDKKHHKEVCLKEPQKRRRRNSWKKPMVDTK